MLIIFSLISAVILALAAKGAASLINEKYDRNIQGKHLHMVVLPLIIAFVIS
ncbi:hypothetical protein SAMN04490205_1577 [Pseudomonas trivialis]|uniref:Uncharacterized protein n=1 Tax=Pseudomonas trivialis TaxID=200450 RepID=A0ABY0U6C9_9PSED|nr:hypothetical protein SAMN04490205_1577 [Pseudomonas trivialis]